MVKPTRAWVWGAALLALAVPLIVLLAPTKTHPTAPAPSVRLIDLRPPPPMPTAPLFGTGPAVPAPAGPQLVGIVGRLPDDAVALIRQPDGRTRTLRPGEAIDGWTLSSLSADAAAFTRGGERLRVAMPAAE